MVQPAAPYDRTMKRLTNLFPVDFVRLVLGQDACRAEPLEIAAQDRELPTDVYATIGSEPRMSTAG